MEAWCFRESLYLRKIGDIIKIYRHKPERKDVTKIEVLFVPSNKKDHDCFILSEKDIPVQQIYIEHNKEVIYLKTK